MVVLRWLLTAALLAASLGIGSTARAYIGEGVQGRPHGGHAAQRYYNFRHGYGYKRYPHRRYRR